MTSTLQHSTERREDAACQTSAASLLASLTGTAPDDLRWDHVHHLQGHATCSGRPIVVIAARDESRTAIVMTRDDWDLVRRCDALDRECMLRSCVIRSHERFLQMLASN